MPRRSASATDCTRRSSKLIGKIKDSVDRAHFDVVLLTCGPAAIWSSVAAWRLAGGLYMPVVGGGRLDKHGVVTPQRKGDLVRHLQTIYRCEVLAFGRQPARPAHARAGR